VAAALSLQASVEVPLTLALVGHLLLLAAWYLMLVNDPPTPRLASLVLVAVLGTQAGLAVLQAVTQTTAWLAGLNLPWPGSLVAATPGASVVQTAGGGRWMRAYGTLSHPNILGGYLVIGLGAALERYRATRRRGWLGVGWLILAGLLLSFSRSAWVAAGVMLAVAGAFWLLHRPSPLDRARARRWVAAGLGALTLLSLPVLPMLLARTNLGGAPLRLEQRSTDDRSLLNRAAVEMLLDRPLAGVGGGAFVVRLYQVTQGSLPLEPAHNLPLLLAAELGWPGSVAMGVLAAGAAWRLWRRRLAGQRSGLAQAELLMGALLAGLLTVGLFDHYWWTMPPARLALVTVLGLWVGWGEAGEATWPESRARADSALFAKRSAAPPLG
jgi:O-antigen ligase